METKKVVQAKKGVRENQICFGNWYGDLSIARIDPSWKVSMHRRDIAPKKSCPDPNYSILVEKVQKCMVFPSLLSADAGCVAPCSQQCSAPHHQQTYSSRRTSQTPPSSECTSCQRRPDPRGGLQSQEVGRWWLRHLNTWRCWSGPWPSWWSHALWDRWGTTRAPRRHRK